MSEGMQYRASERLAELEQSMDFLCDQLNTHVTNTHEQIDAHHQQVQKFAHQVNVASVALSSAVKQIETLAVRLGDLAFHTPLERGPTFSQGSVGSSVFKAARQDRQAPLPVVSKTASILAGSKLSKSPGFSLPKAPEATIDLKEIEPPGSYYSENVYLEVGDTTVLLVHTASPRLESLSTLVGQKKALARLILQRPIFELFKILDAYPGWTDVVRLEDVKKKTKKLRAMFPPSSDLSIWKFFQKLG